MSSLRVTHIALHARTNLDKLASNTFTVILMELSSLQFPATSINRYVNEVTIVLRVSVVSHVAVAFGAT